MTDQLVRESYLIGNTSKEVEARYDIQNKLIKATGKEAAAIINAAKALDQYNRASKEAAERSSLLGDTLKEINDSIDDFNKSNLDQIGDKLLEDAHKSVKVFGEIDEAAKKTSESIKDSITDALIRGFDDGNKVLLKISVILLRIFSRHWFLSLH